MLKSLIKQHDPWALAVIGITFMLFAVALFIKGMKHDVLLEAGVFLVSLKLIMMNYKHSVEAKETWNRLDNIYKVVRDRQP